MIANYNFGFTPEYTLSMGFTLLTNMLAEYTSLMNVDTDEKQGKFKVKQEMQGIVIGATPFNRDQKEISPI